MLRARRLRAGLLGVGVMTAVIALGGAASARAEPAPDPAASFCAQFAPIAAWYPAPFQLCRQALQRMRVGSRPVIAPPRQPVHPKAPPRRAAWHRRPFPLRPAAPPRGRPAAPVAARPAPIPAVPAARPQAGQTDGAGLPAPNLLAWLLLPLAGAIFFALHRLVVAPAGGGGRRVVPRPDQDERRADPFVLPPAIGLRGPGATDAARFLALAALEAGDVLVVIPRPDANLLFGVGEDEFLDDGDDRLFMPGTLDGGLSFLETELADPERHAREAPRLLLVADGADRARPLLDRHPDAVSAVSIDDPGDGSVIVDEDGAVTARPGLTGSLPSRLPAVSRTEARDRLTALLD